MDTRRLILFVVFAASSLFLWDAWQRQHAPLTTISPTEITRVTPSGAPTSSGTTGSTPAMARAGDVPNAPAATAVSAGQEVHIKTDLLDVAINTEGGVIDELRLLQHRAALDDQKPYTLLENDSARLFVAQSGFLRGSGLPDHKTLYQVEPGARELEPNANVLTVKLTTSSSPGVQVTQTYTFHRGSYVVDLDYEVVNGGTTTLNPEAYYQLVRDNKKPEGQHSMVPAYAGVAIYDDQDKFKKVDFSDIDKGKTPYTAKTDNGWVGMLEHYFVAAWLPSDTTRIAREFYTRRLDDRPGGTPVYAAGVIVPMGAVAAGQTGKLSVPFYAGPEEQERIAEIAKGLNLTVDYGIFTVVAKPLFILLRWLHKIVGNWGWAIVLLTMLIKGVFYPLNAASARSMGKLKLVSPKMKALQEQYANDKQKLQVAMMELYRTEKINPLGGCLPIVVQMPVFLALYWVLLGAVELRHAPWIGWIKDLSGPDPFYVLPVLYAISAYLQVKLNPTPAADPAQQRMMQIMPIAFSVMFVFFPSGLVLYWLVNNLLSIAQQWRMNTVLARENAQAQARRR